MGKKKKATKDEILGVYELFDTDDIPTGELLAMTADACGCEIEDVIDALASE